MGRPIKKQWFTAKAGAPANIAIHVWDLDVDGGPPVPFLGTEAIYKQTGTGVYETGTVLDSVHPRYKLIATPPVSGDEADPATGTVGKGHLSFTDAGQGVSAKNVRKITQYRVYFFDTASPASAVWRDEDGNFVGLFDPAPVAEAGDPVITSLSIPSNDNGEDVVIDKAREVTEEPTGGVTPPPPPPPKTKPKSKAQKPKAT